MKAPAPSNNLPPAHSARRFEELDGLRGLASLTVFFSHVYYMQKVDVVPPVISTSLLRSFWDGTAAVYLFFILSGFVLALPYLGTTRRPIELIPYIVRRFFRIHPAYVFGLVLSLILMRFVFVQGSLNDLSTWIRSFWTGDVSIVEVARHLSMIGPDTTKIDPPVWTLKLELMISIVFPLVIYVLQGGNSKIICAGIVCLFLAIFVAKPSAFIYFALFIGGGILAKYHLIAIERIRNLTVPTGALLLVAAFCLYSSRFTVRVIGENDTLWHFLVSLGASLLIILAISYAPFTSLLRTRPVRFLGEISYGFYLVHFPILLAVSSLTFPWSKSILFCATVALVLSMALSLFVARFVERPFQNIGRRLSKRPALSFIQANFGAKILPQSIS